jgi:E3 ubiquitin-protein ligase BOI and related proteins
MAVQAQQGFSHATLPHDLGHAFGGCGMLLDALGVGSGCTGGIGDAVFGGEAQLPRSKLSGNGNDVGSLPRKRARVASVGLMEGGLAQQDLQALPVALSQGQLFAGDVHGRAFGCGATTTSGRAVLGDNAFLSQGVLSQLYHQDAVVAAVERLAAGRLRAAEAELERAWCRNAELEERLRQLTTVGQAWLGVARSHEAVAAGLRATLDQLLLQQPVAGALAVDDAEDAQSCCFETDNTVAGAADGFDEAAAASSCKACRGADACVLLLTCRHLCLCRACDAAVDTCPVCAATKNATLQVLLS